MPDRPQPSPPRGFIPYVSAIIRLWTDVIKRTSENPSSRDCLKIPDKPHSGLQRVLKMGPRSANWPPKVASIHTLQSLLAIFQTVSLGSRVNKGRNRRGGGLRRTPPFYRDRSLRPYSSSIPLPHPAPS